MLEQLQNKFHLDVHQKLYEKETPLGNLAVYQTSHFGTLLTIDNEIALSETDGFFYHEMMAHPALYTHPLPQTVVILGHYHGILQEVLKHHSVKEIWCVTECSALDEVMLNYFAEYQQNETQDARVKFHIASPLNWIKEKPAAMFDVIIQAQHSNEFMQEHYQHFFHALKPNGILVQPCLSIFTHLKTLKSIFHTLNKAGFEDNQTLIFPQPSFANGSRTILMANKNSEIKRIREKDIYNREFLTRYYNYDMHKAALALPEFAKKEFEEV